MIFRQIFQRESNIRTHVVGYVDEVIAQFDTCIHESLELVRIRRFHLLFYQADLSFQVRTCSGSLIQMYLYITCLQDYGRVSARHFEYAQYASDNSNRIQIRQSRLFYFHGFLRCNDDVFLFLHRFMYEFQRSTSSCRNGHDYARKHHHVTQCHDGDFLLQFIGR